MVMRAGATTTGRAKEGSTVKLQKDLSGLNLDEGDIGVIGDSYSSNGQKIKTFTKSGSNRALPIDSNVPVIVIKESPKDQAKIIKARTGVKDWTRGTILGGGRIASGVTKGATKGLLWSVAKGPKVVDDLGKTGRLFFDPNAKVARSIVGKEKRVLSSPVSTFRYDLFVDTKNPRKIVYVILDKFDGTQAYKSESYRDIAQTFMMLEPTADLLVRRRI